MPVSTMSILRQSLQQQNLNTIQTTFFRSPFSNPINNSFRFTRGPKSTDICMGCGEKRGGRKTVQKINSKINQTGLEGTVLYNYFDTNIKLIDGF